MAFTGLVAIVLVFLAGPYRSFQKRWPKTWGPRLPLWVHINISLAAVSAVLIHIAPRLHKIGLGIPWVASGFVVVTVLSGACTMYIARSASDTKRLVKVHRLLAYAFWLSIVPHAFAQGVGVWTIVVAILLGWVLWWQRLWIGEFLVKATWPFSRGKTVDALRKRRER